MKRTCLHTITNTNEQNSCEFHLVEQLFEKRNLDPKDNQFVKNFVLMKNKITIISLLYFLISTSIVAFAENNYKFKVYLDISNGPETSRLENKSLWFNVSENCDGPWLLTWELRKGSYFTNATLGMTRKQNLGAAFKNKEAIIEVPQHWSWDNQEIPLHEQVALDCGFTRKGIVYYYEDASVTSVLFPPETQIKQEVKTELNYPTVDFVMNKHSAFHEVYILAREWKVNQPPQKQFDKSLDGCHGVCFEFQVPYKNNTPPTNMWAGIQYALQTNKKVMLLMPAPNNINDKECFTYLEGVKKLFNDLKTNVPDALNNPNVYLIPNSYDWDKKYYRLVPETTPDGQIANTASGAALWLLMQRDSTIYTVPEQRKNPVSLEWKTTGIGTGLATGEVFQFNDTIVIKGGAYDGSAVQQKDDEPFRGTVADKQFFMYQKVAGDCNIQAKILLPPFSDRWGRCGVMIRENFEPGSKFGAMTASSGAGTTFQCRETTNATSVLGQSSTNFNITPQWVRIERKGSVVTAYSSSDGVAWNAVGSKTIAMDSEVYVGLMTTNHAQTGSLAFNLDLNQYPGYVSNLQLVGDVVSARNSKLNSSLLTCFPNPTTGKIAINYCLTSNGNASLLVHDIAGRLVYEKTSISTIKGTYSETVDLKSIGLKNGIYFFELKQATGDRQISKIVIN